MSFGDLHPVHVRLVADIIMKRLKSFRRYITISDLRIIKYLLSDGRMEIVDMVKQASPL
jgi:hypothetical protein